MSLKMTAAAVCMVLVAWTNAFAVCEAPVWVDQGVPPELTQQSTFFSQTIGQSVSYLIYLPPSYQSMPGRSYPVLYWLHGGGSGSSGSAIVPFFDDAMRRGVSPEFIVVLPHGEDTMWTDSNPGRTPFDAPIESILMNDLIPHIDATYRTIATRFGRGIEGFSMGGRGSSRLGLKYPDRFSVVSNLSGAVQPREFWQADREGIIYRCVYGNDDAYYDATDPFTHASQNAGLINSQSSYHFRIMVGTLDRKNVGPNSDLSSHLTNLGIDHSFVSVPGVRHSYEDLYLAQGDSIFTFFRDAWGGVLADSLPPSVPTGLTGSAASGSQIDLAWTPSTDNVGVTGYNIRRNGLLVATVEGPAYSDTGLRPKLTYTYTVSALDAEGNESAQSSSISLRTPLR
jgi:endo-1,4-beta-xylanase